METCEEVGYHEAGHAIGAIKLRIGLEPKGIHRQPACKGVTYVQESSPEERTEDWCVRRAAVKLSGPAAECRLRDQVYNRETLASQPHYFGDYRDAIRILQSYQSQQGTPNPIRLEEQLLEALKLAKDVISDNWHLVKEVAKASEQEPELTAEKILSIVRTAEGASM
jgi:hypothetical protein